MPRREHLKFGLRRSRLGTNSRNYSLATASYLEITSPYAANIMDSDEETLANDYRQAAAYEDEDCNLEGIDASAGCCITLQVLGDH